MYPPSVCLHRCTRDSTEGSRIAHVPYIFDAGLVRGGDIGRPSRRTVSAGAMVGSTGQAIRYGRSLPAAMYRSYQS